MLIVFSCDTGNNEATNGNDTVSTSGTKLTINNQSFTEITDVMWQNVTFVNNQFENSIKPSTNVTNTVQPGGGYIFFKRKTNPIIARTSEIVIIENNKQVEFTFTENTVIVEVNNPNNNGTLGILNSTVIWFDDAEGDYLPYVQRINTVYSSKYSRYGNKCIFLDGYINPAELTFNIPLTKKAKITFWHRCDGVSGYFTSSALNVNNLKIKGWDIKSEWSFFESFIEAGDITIKFVAGQLYIDDLLIYYIE